MHDRFIVFATLIGIVAAACSSPPPSFEEPPPAEELYAEALDILDGYSLIFFRVVDTDMAIETLQEIIDNYPYSDYAVKAELKIADANFNDGKYEEALSYYRDFADLHPQHEEVPYAILRSALCYERRVNAANRDQTATRNALLHLDRLLSTYPQSPQAREAEILWHDLRTRLAENIVQIAEFYMKRSEYESAAERFRSLLNEYPGLGFDPLALYNLGICYLEMGRFEEADRILQSIVQNYRDSKFAKDAAVLISDQTQAH